jgi:hypothetical protein
MSASTIHHGARALLAGLVLGAAVVACTGGHAAPGGAPEAGTRLPSPIPASQATRGSSVEQLLANVRAARDSHDTRSLALFRAELISRVGETTIQAGRAAYGEALVNLRAAGAAHDGRARARFHAELVALCDSGNPVSAFEACDLDLAAATR